ncbi:PEP-CTERM sorting domain-containing protein [Methylophilus sp. OH31]|uniref:PEP-CTERM sorting domain-containing protein n=1 Tax=Methylophilus sp. OH31 TaxID=1387312 RepID=UPI000463763E|nr:PEP-CTERM sorting domain-containing protein [Methylophilus sp. OH31]
MLRLSVLSCLLACLPLASHASAEISLASTSCSGDMTLSSGSGISLACTGNLSLDGGWLKSDSLISLFARGDLTLNNLSLYAPEITLSNLTGTLTIGSNVLLDITPAVASGAINISSGLPKPVIAWQSFDIGLNPGAIITVGTGNASVINRVMGHRPDLAGSLSLTSAQSQLSLNASRLNLINSAGINVSAVPEPDSYMLLLTGLGLMACRRKAKQTAKN